MKPKGIVVFDVDGVLTNGAFSLDIASKLGIDLDDIVNDIDNSIKSGGDPIAEVRKGVSLFKGTHYIDILKIVRETPLIKNAKEAIDKLHDLGYKVALISHGIADFAMHDIALRLGADFSHSIGMVLDDEGVLTGEMYGILGNKEKVIHDIIRLEGLSLDDVVLIADDKYHRDYFGLCGASIAFNACPELKEVADYAIDSDDLMDIIPVIQKISSEK